jgi:hypothetical protein
LLSEIEVGAATIDGSPRVRPAAAQRIGLRHVLEMLGLGEQEHALRPHLKRNATVVMARHLQQQSDPELRSAASLGQMRQAGRLRQRALARGVQIVSGVAGAVTNRQPAKHPKSGAVCCPDTTPNKCGSDGRWSHHAARPNDGDHRCEIDSMRVRAGLF